MCLGVHGRDQWWRQWETWLVSETTWGLLDPRRCWVRGGELEAFDESQRQQISMGKLRCRRFVLLVFSHNFYLLESYSWFSFILCVEKKYLNCGKLNEGSLDKFEAKRVLIEQTCKSHLGIEDLFCHSVPKVINKSDAFIPWVWNFSKL